MLRVKARGHKDLITVVGHVASVSPGEFVQASGNWINDRTRGVQFKAYLRAVTNTAIGLGSVFGGAALVVDAGGNDLLRVSRQGDIDVLGILGLSDGTVRNGYQGVRVTFHVEGDADEETLRAIVEQSRKRSAVYDVLTNPTPVSVEVVTG